MPAEDPANDRRKTWTFLSNHAHVLLCLARDPDVRLRDVAAKVGLTERAVHRIVNELEAGLVVTRVREGRRNRYEVDLTVALRHPLESERTVGSLLEMLCGPDEGSDDNIDSSFQDFGTSSKM